MKIIGRHWKIPAVLPVALLMSFFAVQTAWAAENYKEFPQKNAWVRTTPSVVWCGDETSTVTIEVHIVGRNDVRKVWAADPSDKGNPPPIETLDDETPFRLFDDGSHGDAQAGDNVF